jgi:hypothetical protein
MPRMELMEGEPSQGLACRHAGSRVRVVRKGLWQKGATPEPVLGRTLDPTQSVRVPCHRGGSLKKHTMPLGMTDVGIFLLPFFSVLLMW